MTEIKDKIRSINPLPGLEKDRADDLKDIQGDIYPSFSKKVEVFWFFEIDTTKKAEFRQGLAKLKDSITTSQQVIGKLQEIKDVRAQFIGQPREVRRQNLVEHPQINISFSARGMSFLGYNPALVRDDIFAAGMMKSAITALGDQPDPNQPDKPNWEQEYRDTIHGVVVIAAESRDTLVKPIETVQEALGDSLFNQFILEGNERPGDQAGHEHFGWKDGISQPSLRGWTDPLPGQLECDAGRIIFGQKGDSITRPSWTKNGSIMAFRKHRQLVPEFHKFLKANPTPVNGQNLSQEEQIALTGARMFGRWASGTPTDLAPYRDVPEVGSDNHKNNNFDYSVLDPRDTKGVPGQFRCPFAAHARKTAPRIGTSFGLGNTPEQKKAALEASMIVRAAIPYGPELADYEKITKKTSNDRGLAFVCYQTNLARGYSFMQQLWSNNTTFPFQAAEISSVPPGFDPVVGANRGKSRDTSGVSVDAQGTDLTMPKDFILAKGGEYFFVPSLTTIGIIAAGGPLDA